MSAPPVRNPFKIGLFAHLASQEQLRKLHIVVHVTWPSVTSRQTSGDAVIRYFAWGRSDMGSTRSHAWRTHTDGRGGRCSGAALRNVFYSRSTIWLLGGRYHPACLMNRRESVQQPEGKSVFHSTTSINNFRIFDIHLLSSICCSAVEGHVIDVSWDHWAWEDHTGSCESLLQGSTTPALRLNCSENLFLSNYFYLYCTAKSIVKMPETPNGRTWLSAASLHINVQHQKPFSSFFFLIVYWSLAGIDLRWASSCEERNQSTAVVDPCGPWDNVSELDWFLI